MSASARLGFWFIVIVVVFLVGLKIKDMIAASDVVGCFSVSERFQYECKMDQYYRQRERDKLEKKD